MKRGRFINLAGPPAGVGKNALMNALIEKHPELHLVRLITYTTRPPRSHEKPGRDYHFVTRKKFAELAKKRFFLERKKLENHWYGTPLSDIESIIASGNNILTHADAQRIKFFKKRYPDMIAIFVDATEKELTNRMLGRGDTKQTIRRRLSLARRERRFKKYFDRSFQNREDQFDQTVEQIAEYLRFRLE